MNYVGHYSANRQHQLCQEHWFDSRYLQCLQKNKDRYHVFMRTHSVAQDTLANNIYIYIGGRINEASNQLCNGKMHKIRHIEMNNNDTRLGKHGKND